MTKDTQDLLNLFGQLFQQKIFVAAAIRSNQEENNPQFNQRGQLRVMRLLLEKDQLTNSQIVEALDIRPSSASVLVSKLEESGLVKKTESPDDKRVTFISLTDNGREAITKSRKFKDDLSDSLFESLSDSEQQQLGATLKKLIVDLENKLPKWDEQRDWSNFFNAGRGFKGMQHPRFPHGFDFHNHN